MAESRARSYEETRYQAETTIPQLYVLADGSRVLLAEAGQLVSLSPRSEVELRVPILDDTSAIERLSASEDGSVVALHQSSGKLRVFETDTRQWSGPIAVGKLRDLSVSPSGEVVAVAAEDSVVGFRPSLDALWPTPVNVVTCGIATSKLGGEVLVASWDGELRWYDSAGASLAKVETGVVIDRIAASEDLDLVAGVADSNSLHLWSRDGRTLFQQKLAGNAIGLAIAADGATIVVPQQDGSAVAIGKDGRLRFRFTPAAGGLNGLVRILGNPPDVLLGGGDQRIYYVDRDGNLVWGRNLRSRVAGLSASSNGRTIAAVNQDRLVHVLTVPNASTTVPPPPRTASAGRRPPPPPPPPPPSAPANVPSVSVPAASAPPPAPRPAAPAPPIADLSGIDPSDSMAILGETGSGKTTFLGVMPVAFADPKYAGEFNLTYGLQGLHYVSTIRLGLQRGNWPSGTASGQTFLVAASLNWKNKLHQLRVRHIIMTDIAGEVFRDHLGTRGGVRHAIPQEVAPAVDRLVGSGGFLFLVDGTAEANDLAETGLDLYAFVQMVIERSRLGEKKPLRRPIAVVLNKYDEMPGDRKARPAPDVVRECMPDLYRLLQLRVPEELVLYAYCSPVGSVIKGEGREKPKIRLPLAPYNVASTIVWVATHMAD